MKRWVRFRIVGGDRECCGRRAQHARVQRLDQDGPYDVCDGEFIRFGHGATRRGLEGEGNPRRAFIARGARDFGEALIQAASDWEEVSLAGFSTAASAKRSSVTTERGRHPAFCQSISVVYGMPLRRANSGRPALSAATAIVWMMRSRSCICR